MKFVNKILLIFAFVGFISACDLDLDQQINPNALDPSTASLDDLYNSIQLSFKSVKLRVENIRLVRWLECT